MPRAGGSDAVTEARRAALALLQSVERGRRLDVAWEEAAPRLTEGDRAWVQEAAFGTVRLRGRLDHLLHLHLHHGISSLAPSLRPVLRLGAYQLLYMDAVPAYAAVSQTVEQARAVAGRGSTGLVNAVLRALAREGAGPERFPGLDDDPEEHLVTWGSHPRWLVRRWLERFGAHETAALVESDNRIPRLWIRPLGVEPPDAVVRLAAAGIEGVAGPEGSGTIRLERGGSPAAALAAVPSVVQDPGAAWVVAWVGDVEDARTVDLCAAPGGKAMGLAARGAWTVAADRSAVRLQRVREAAVRVGLPARVVVSDAATPPFGAVDLVLVDAPCSGTGTFARHPDARWRLSEGDPAAFAETQGRLLDGAAGIVEPGGLLVYSTCTLEPEENEGVVEAFLRRHEEFMLEGGPDLPSEVRDGSFLRVLPQRTGTDGSFAARLRRRRKGTIASIQSIGRKE